MDRALQALSIGLSAGKCEIVDGTPMIGKLTVRDNMQVERLLLLSGRDTQYLPPAWYPSVGAR